MPKTSSSSLPSPQPPDIPTPFGSIRPLLRQPQVLSLVPFSRATLFRSIKADKFPRPVKLSERVSAWRSEDIQAWMDRQSDRR